MILYIYVYGEHANSIYFRKVKSEQLNFINFSDNSNENNIEYIKYKYIHENYKYLHKQNKEAYIFLKNNYYSKVNDSKI